jgi:hypothetical protein
VKARFLDSVRVELSIDRGEVRRRQSGRSRGRAAIASPPSRPDPWCSGDESRRCDDGGGWVYGIAQELLGQQLESGSTRCADGTSRFSRG